MKSTLKYTICLMSVATMVGCGTASSPLQQPKETHRMLAGTSANSVTVGGSTQATPAAVVAPETSTGLSDSSNKGNDKTSCNFVYDASGSVTAIECDNKTLKISDIKVKDGVNGTNGVDGKDGINGLNGTNGVNGLNGINGLNGSDGKDGVNGVNGQDGATGLQGPQGIAGINGKDGKDGANGVDGAVGPQGLQGVAGVDGSNGQNGTDGKDGTNGVNGQDGATGIQGIQGIAGVNGINGKDGAVGPQGPQGLAGVDGTNGTNGKDGAVGPQGIAGVDGKDGATGATGATGQQGTPGVNGTTGRVVLGLGNMADCRHSYYLFSDETLILKEDDSSVGSGMDLGIWNIPLNASFGLQIAGNTTCNPMTYFKNSTGDYMLEYSYAATGELRCLKLNNGTGAINYSNITGTSGACPR